MSVKSFKFVSPGVFINEIDNSFIPKSADAIGPVVIGRSRRGLAMTPVKVNSYSDFVTEFGDTVAGSGGGDVYRNGNYQSPMYGTYAAKAFLRANVAPVTFIRLLGQQTTAGGTAGGDAAAGWATSGKPTSAVSTNGGAFGMWLFQSGTTADLGEGRLAAVWYLNKGALFLSGNIVTSPGGNAADIGAKGTNTVIQSDSNGLFNMYISGWDVKEEVITFGFDDTQETFLRKRFNTNPQVASDTATSFFPEVAEKAYWLGESYEQAIRRDGFASTSALFGVLIPLGAYTGDVQDADTTMSNMKSQAQREAVAGWFIGQDLGLAGAFRPEDNAQKLFRLKGRGHGEWLHKNCKVSIDKIRQSTAASDPYGTFSVLIRDIRDTDSKIVVLERFDNCTLDPKSPNYIGRKIGTEYVKWDTTTKELKSYGDYPNNSKYVYVEMNDDVEAGSTPSPTLLPFGYFGPPKPASITATGSMARGGLISSFYQDGRYIVAGDRNGVPQDPYVFFSGSTGLDPYGVHEPGNAMTGTLVWPSSSIRVSASDGGLKDPTSAYFGFSSTRNANSTRPDSSLADFHRLPYASYADDPTTGAYVVKGINAWSYIFSLDDVSSSVGGAYSYRSGSRLEGNSVTSASYTDLLNAGYNRFTAPFWGGADGFDIMKPDPLYNNGIGASATEDTSYTFHTWRRAIDTVSDSEMTDMNVLTAPGLTQETLTGHMVDVCEERGDCLALIDLPSVYIPPHEAYYTSKDQRLGTTVDGAARQLSDRRIDSSYGATFYPWVQTRDENTGQLVWLPPSAAILGVLGSSEAKTDVWFAPAGFNRGSLTDGAAGIPIVNVTERLTSDDRDTLYEYNINPIAAFPSSGVVLFGQKTLQERQSALDRINVRRLVIYMKKQISILSTQILFEQNVQATWNRFKGLVEPFLANVKTRFGITDYRLILDESTTTPDLIDQNIMYAKIMIKPARAIEFIAIDFVVLNTGASFDD
tara:strand:- start:2044 stop:4980 length:2937 start_codon:yes stop_codon:yes gene_type:complete